MLRFLAVFFGVFFVLIGALGFIPEMQQNGKLLGLFAVNTLLNIVHFVTGILALLSGFKSARSAKFFFILAGLVYAIFAFLGFYNGEGMLFDVIRVNSADSLFHAVVAAIWLYAAFGLDR